MRREGRARSVPPAEFEAGPRFNLALRIAYGRELPRPVAVMRLSPM